MGITPGVLDDGNMDDINDEEPTESTEPGETNDPSNVEDVQDAEEPAQTDDAAQTEAPEDTPPADDTLEMSSDQPVEDELGADATAEEPAVDDGPSREPSQPNPIAPPPYQHAQDNRLTRDPYATLGGVLSGIAHRYGWDVSLTRLAFVVLLIVSGGTAIVAYLLAWLIIPRASHWPPARVPTTSRSRLSGRDLGIGLIGLGALVVLGIGSGEAAAVLVPLALVGGGLWLLIQNPRDSEDEMPRAARPVDAPVAPAQPAMMASMPPVAPQPTVLPQQTVLPQPVPKRSGFRRIGIIGLFSFLGLLLLAIIAVPLILFAVITDGDFDLDDQEYVYRPATIVDIPTDISEGAGEIRLDLRRVDFSALDSDADPIRVDVELDVGRIEVLLPEDVRVAVDAEADLGDVTVFGSNDDGIKPSRSIEQEDPQLDLELDLNAGEIVVARDNMASVTTIEVG